MSNMLLKTISDAIYISLGLGLLSFTQWNVKE